MIDVGQNVFTNTTGQKRTSVCPPLTVITLDLASFERGIAGRAEERQANRNRTRDSGSRGLRNLANVNAHHQAKKDVGCWIGFEGRSSELRRGDIGRTKNHQGFRRPYCARKSDEGAKPVDSALTQNFNVCSEEQAWSD